MDIDPEDNDQAAHDNPVMFIILPTFAGAAEESLAALIHVSTIGLEDSFRGDMWIVVSEPAFQSAGSSMIVRGITLPCGPECLHVREINSDTQCL